MLIQQAKNDQGGKLKKIKAAKKKVEEKRDIEAEKAKKAF